MNKIALILSLLILPCVAFKGAGDELPKVLIIGDSIAGGYLPHVKELLKGKAIVTLPTNEQGETFNCEGTTKGAREIKEWIGDTEWDVIHFNFGLHDIKHIDPETGKNSKNLDHPQQANPEQYRRNLISIVKVLKSTGARLIFATTTPYPDTLGRQMRSPGMPKVYNKVAMEVMSEYGIEVNDLYSFVLPRMEELQRPENVHFTEAGSKALARQVADAIMKGSGSERVDAEVIYPKIRIWTSPSSGEEPKFNSPSLQWPAKKGATYSVRIARSRDFRDGLITKEDIPFAIFNPHRKLEEGAWYWQYRINDQTWNKVDSFSILPTTREFETPHISKVLSGVPETHPRVLAWKDQLEDIQSRAGEHKESALIIQKAEKHLNSAPPKEESALPAFTGKNKFENNKIASLASKTVGWNIYDALNILSQAYILTGNDKYFLTIRQWMLEISTWDPKGASHTNNFGDSGIMTGLAIGLDTFWDKLTQEERETIIGHIKVRAEGFYRLWIGQIESRSSSMHVWQHILHRMLQTSLALMGEIPEAGVWAEYIYELWIAQSPKMGENDGAWFNGTGYFRMNTVTMYDICEIFNHLTGVDFMWSDWYRNNPRWLFYAFPPNSVADGFCNDGDKHPVPNVNYAGYADAAAGRFNDEYAALYAKECLKGQDMELSDDNEWAWYRIKRDSRESSFFSSDNFEIPQAAVFPDVGVAYMHTTLPDVSNNLMLSIRSSPFGSLAHTHADQNGFNIAYGGKRLFYNTGYRPSMGDPHFLGWYKHTRGHNAVLIDGKGQPFNAGSYGWIPRFLHGKKLSYAVGDASNAYSGTDQGEDSDHGLKLFRRHFIMIRPSTIVIYDELEADHPAQWSWLLHNDSGFELDAENGTLQAGNEHAHAKLTLYSSTELDLQISSEFSVPTENWTRKTDSEGNLIEFKDQWHFSGVSGSKKDKMRYLAIIQVVPGRGDSKPDDVILDEQANSYRVGDWRIKAELDCEKQAKIEVMDFSETAAFTSSGDLEFRGRSYGRESESAKLVENIDGAVAYDEVIDAVPLAIQKALLRVSQK